MKISDQISLSARNLARRKGRTALTLIGVVIGTCMVVLMISLGIAQSASNDEMLQSWGDLTVVQVYGGGSSSQVGADGKTLHLNDAMLEMFRKMPHVVAASPYENAYSLQATLSAGTGKRYQTEMSNTNTMAIDPASMESLGFSLTEGRWLDTGPANAKAAKLEVLVCEQTGYVFEDTRKSTNNPKRRRYSGQTDASGNPLLPFVDINKDVMTLTMSTGEGSSTKTKSWQLEVVGTLAPDQSKGWWVSDGMVLRLQDYRMLLKEYAELTNSDKKNALKDYNSVNLKVDEIDNVDGAIESLMEMGFSKDNIYSMTQQRDEMQKQVFRQQMIFGGIAAVSLLVAAINIINTMTMAIYERTREIGIMKVLGCEIMSIRSMFLLESSGIGFLGGLIGVVLSIGASFFLNHLSDIVAALGGTIDLSGLMGGGYYMEAGSSIISIIPPWLLGGALIFATMIGLVAGIIPANNAVKISALEAIRHD